MTKINVQNLGSMVERSGRLVEIRETIPPFATVEIARAPRGKSTTERDAIPVWYASKPGPEAYQRPPGELAINGPVPIVYGGFGEVVVGEAGRATVKNTADFPRVHDGLGPRNDSWHLWPCGDQFTCQGLDETLAREQGGAKTGDRWTRLPEVAVVLVAPRTPDLIWMHGFSRLTRYATTPGTAEIEAAKPVQYRLYQPKKPAWVFAKQKKTGKYQDQSFEPINDDLNHAMPGDPEKAEEDRLPWYTDVGWCKVRDAGTYLIHFAATLSYDSPQDTPFGVAMAVGLFGAKPAPAGKTGHYKGYVRLEQPAGVISRMTRSRTYDGSIPDLTAVHLWHTEENAATAAVIELDAGWAFGFLPIPAGAVHFNVAHFSCSVVRIGPVSSRQKRKAEPAAEEYWKAIAHKTEETGLYSEPEGNST